MIKQFLIFVYFALLIANFLVALYYLKKKSGNIFILFYFILVIFREVVGFSLQGTTYNRFLIYHILRPFDFAILGLIFKCEIRDKRFKILITILIILFLFFCYFYSFYFNNYNKPTSLNSSIQNVLMLIISLYYFYETYEYSKEINLKRVALFWISIGFMLFSTCTFFSTGFQAYLQKRNPDLAKSIFWINYLASYFLYSMFLIAQLCKVIFRK